MLYPMFRGISSQRREVLDVILINTIIQPQQSAKASPCKDYVRRLQGNVKKRDVRTRISQPWRSQEFFHREVRELYDLVPTFVHNSDQTRTRRQNCLFLVLPPPIWFQLRRLSTGGRPKVDREDFCKLCDPKRTDSNGEAL